MPWLPAGWHKVMPSWEGDTSRPAKYRWVMDMSRWDSGFSQGLCARRPAVAVRHLVLAAAFAACALLLQGCSTDADTLGGHVSAKKPSKQLLLGQLQQLLEPQLESEGDATEMIDFLGNISTVELEALVEQVAIDHTKALEKTLDATKPFLVAKLTASLTNLGVFSAEMGPLLGSCRGVDLLSAAKSTEVSPTKLPWEVFSIAKPVLMSRLGSLREAWATAGAVAALTSRLPVRKQALAVLGFLQELLGSMPGLAFACSANSEQGKTQRPWQSPA
ncbi:unnamed protein product [Polarella glacialis]|uniref:Uncharacterized protein n=1 Tax=Polarella glacialis TaxID=89957 RepID=A0A813F4V9_POLGL|nr:unnamed protein product [Polarella glacialis]